MKSTVPVSQLGGYVAFLRERITVAKTAGNAPAHEELTKLLKTAEGRQKHAQHLRRKR